MMSQQEKKIIMNRIHESGGEDDFFRYKHLKAALDRMTPEQLEQRVQILPGSPIPEPIQLEPAIFIGTIEEMCHVDGEVATETRSEEDDQHHPEQVVIGRDNPSRSPEGDTAYEWDMDNDVMIGNKTGKRFAGFSDHEVKEYDQPNNPTWRVKEYVLTPAMSAFVYTEKAPSGERVRYELTVKEEEGEKSYSVSQDLFELFLHNVRGR